MFTRKSLGPANCASCDKNLHNILGEKVEFSPHKKMPFRETHERIARYGQGFSRMLSTVQPTNVELPHESSHQAFKGLKGAHATMRVNQMGNSPSGSLSPHEGGFGSSRQELYSLQPSQVGHIKDASIDHNIWDDQSESQLIPAGLHPDYSNKTGQTGNFMGETGFNENSFKTAVTSAAIKNQDAAKTQGMFFSKKDTSRTILEVPHATPDVLQNN